MAKASYDFGSVKKQAQADQERKNGGGKIARMKLNAGGNYVLVLPPYKKGLLYKRVMVHQLWKGGKPIMTVTCGRAHDGNDCPVCDYGFKLKDKHADSSSEKKQNMWKNFMPTNDVHINALQLKKNKKTGAYDTDGTPKVLKLPNDAVELLLTEIDESADGMDIFGLDDGRPLFIKGNGKDGKQRRYPVIKFAKGPANLVDEGVVDEDEVLENITDLDKLEPKFSEKKLNAMLRKLKGKTTGMEDDDDEADESDEFEDEDEMEDEVDATSDDDDDDFEDDDEAEDDEDSEDIEDDDDDDEIEDDEDEDEVEDEDEEPVKKRKKKSSKKKSKKKSSKKKGLRKKRG